MPDAAPIQGAENAYVNIQARLQAITQLQETQLNQMRQMNVAAQVMSKTRDQHLTAEQRLASLQTSIQAKTNRILFLEQRRLAQLATGTLMGQQLALGLANAQNQMAVEVARANEEYSRLLRQMAMSQAQLLILNKTGFGELISKAKDFREAWNFHPIYGVAKIIEHMIDVFNTMDKAAAQFRMSMGFTRNFTESIDANARDIAFNFAHVGVSAQTAYEATEALSKSLFSSMSASKSLVTDVSLMAAQLGISASTSAEFMKSMGIASRSTANVQADMTLFAASMSEAAGVPLGEIMQDVANATKNSYSFIARSGLQLIKASVDAKRMGTSLESATRSAEKLLDFTSSVKSEMEASVLVGKAINLQHARELSYRRDTKGLNAEILRIMKDVNFEALDPFQQESVARALGKSAGELANMAQAERERLGWETSTDPIVRSQLAAYKEMEAATESIAKARGQDMRAQLQQKANQAAIASITQSWHAILQRIGEGVLPFIDMTLKGVAHVVGFINTGIGYINAAADKLNHTFGMMTKFITGAAIAAALLFGARGLGRLTTMVTGGVGRAIQATFSGIARGVGALGGTNVLRGALGIAALGVALFIFAKGIQPFAGTDWKAVFIGIGAIALLGVVAGIMGAFAPEILLGALAIAALGIAMLPFAAAAWITSKALQNLADVPLMKIAAGLASIGAIAPLVALGGMGLGLAAPGMFAFSLVMRLMAGPAERLGKAMIDLGTGLNMAASGLAQLSNISLINTVVQVRSLSSAISELSRVINAMPDLKVEKLKSLVMSGFQQGGEEGKKTSTTDETLSAIKDSIEGLRNDMKAGNLTATVYLDSQKLDSGMSRRLKYTGALT